MADRSHRRTSGGGERRTAADLDRLLRKLGGWNERSWAHHAPDGRSRADVVFAAVQRLADLAADAEGRAPLPVPRPASSAGLADQLAVMAHDVDLTGDRAAAAAAGDVIGRLAAELDVD